MPREVTWAIFEISSLIASMKMILGKDDLGGLDGVTDFVRHLDDGRLKAFHQHGCVPHIVVQKANEVLWVPCGFLAVEKCVKGILIYGLRKSVLYKSLKALASYEANIEVLKQSGKPIEKMKMVHNIIAGSDGDD